jgi:predicted DNA-binding transcriptional regulator YafY
LTFQVAGLDEIKQWIMSLGPEACAEEPKMLKDMVKADLKKTLGQYKEMGHTYLEPEVLESRVDYTR